MVRLPRVGMVWCVQEPVRWRRCVRGGQRRLLRARSLLERLNLLERPHPLLLVSGLDLLGPRLEPRVVVLVLARSVEPADALARVAQDALDLVLVVARLRRKQGWYERPARPKRLIGRGWPEPGAA